MFLVATPDEMRECDRRAIEELGIPGMVLMENACNGIINSILTHYGKVKDKLVFVFCGRGNNGGDGLATARHLYNLGADVYVFMLADPAELKGDAKANFQIVQKIVSNKMEGERFELKVIKNISEVEKLPPPDLIIDAIFGTGFKGEVKGLEFEVIRWINKQKAFKVSIDIPSGVNGETGEVKTVAVNADITPTMGLVKRGLVLNLGRVKSGKVYIVDIGIPKFVYETAGIRTYVAEASDVKEKLPVRPFNANKYNCGKVFALAGSPGLTGAATMCSMSAMKIGAGAVVLGIPESLNPILEEKLTEVMTVPLPETNKHTIGRDAIEIVNKYIDWADVVIIGPGLSKDINTQHVVLNIIENLNKKAVIDADGLNALAGNLKVLKKVKVPVVLTPHTGEFSRLAEINPFRIEINRVEVARKFAVEYEVTLVLKGAPTVIATPDGRAFINETGNPGMATAGSGDVLTGIIAGLMAQGLDPTDAAVCGVYIHGLAGDIARNKFGELPMMAMDIMNLIPEALDKITKE